MTASKTLTLDNFLRRLKRRKYLPWHLQKGNGHIRAIREGFQCCPVTAVCRRLYLTGNFDSSARCMNMDIDLAKAIVNAADRFPCYDKKLRQRILKAIGL